MDEQYAMRCPSTSTYCIVRAAGLPDVNGEGRCVAADTDEADADTLEKLRKSDFTRNGRNRHYSIRSNP